MYRRKSLQLGVDSLEVEYFFTSRNQIQDEKAGLRCIFECLYNVIPLHIDRVHTELDRTRYLRDAYIRKNRTKIEAGNISAVFFNFHNL